MVAVRILGTGLCLCFLKMTALVAALTNGKEPVPFPRGRKRAKTINPDVANIVSPSHICHLQVMVKPMEEPSPGPECRPVVTGPGTAQSPSPPRAAPPLPRQPRRSPPAPGPRRSDRLGPGGGARGGVRGGGRRSPRAAPPPPARRPRGLRGEEETRAQSGGREKREGSAGSGGAGAGPRAPSPRSRARGPGRRRRPAGQLAQ
nr:translation initiation factor IF-2-like [Pan paniscus]